MDRTGAININCAPSPCLDSPIVTPDAPVLSYDAGTNVLSWTWDGAAPGSWQVDFSDDDGASWNFYGSQSFSAGNEMFAGDPGLYRVVGVVASVPVTGYSNSVDVP